MPAPVQPVFPALYLYPLNDSFVPKHISLAHGQRVKIGRQTNAKTAPGERNGYFDSKVLSRQHAEVWEDGNKIFIKDVKSSNGTFINGERLSPEGLESDPYELKSDDIVEYGIDIVGEDNKTIIHHKVAARVVCVFTEQDAQVAARAEQLQQQHLQQYQSSPGQGSSMLAQPGPSNTNANANANGSGSFNFAPGQQRRIPQMAQQGLAGMGGMGGSMRPPGKSGLTFDHILSRLQGELQKSRETGAELHTLTGAMNEIHDTLGGNLPSNIPSYPANLPPVRSQLQPQPATQPSSQEPSAPVSGSGSPEQAAAAPSTALTSSALADLQTQLHETQSSLTSHVDKIRALEGVLAEQEAIKREVRTLREMMEIKRREMENEDDHSQEQEPRGGFDEEDDEENAMHDDDDARSIATVIPHELERVEEENEEELAAEAQEQESREEEEHEKDQGHEDQQEEELEEDEEERRRRNDELGRPRTPEPTNLGMRDGDPFTSHHRSSNLLDRTTKLLAAPRRSSPSSPLSKVAASAASHNPSEEVFEQVLKQVGALMALTSSLEAQHTAAQTTISALESKVQALEATVKATQDAAAASQVQSQTEISPPVSPTQLVTPSPPSLPIPVAEERESLAAMVLEWKKSMEGQWTSVREDWDKERERLNQAREQWEGQVRSMDSGLEKLGAATAALKAQQEQIQQQQQQLQHVGMNGDALKHIGLVTPPSPRSLSSDSNRPRRRKSGGRRGRSRQSSRSRSTGSRDGEVDTDTDATLASEETSPAKGGIVLSASGVYKSALADEGEEDGEEDGEDTVLGVRSKAREESGADTLATPDSSVYKLPTRPKSEDVESSSAPTTKSVGTREREYQIQTFVGVLVVAAAAAAVIWRVKPEAV
ncbi:hypothetical protein FPV67DRAFT_1585724 [Lyophyllum atratum]|nr:hypothetical protein FPV67DRAFT_1585724 [Lyophyllum atratum]